MLISNATVRLLRPECDFLNEWLEEPHKQQAARIVDILYTQCVPEYSNSYGDLENNSEKSLYSATSFAFMFYFLNCVLMNNGEVVGKDESVMGKALRLISEHAQMRRSTDTDNSVRFCLVQKLKSFCLKCFLNHF